MKDFFSYIRRNRDKIISSHGDACSFCLLLSLDTTTLDLPSKIVALFNDIEPDERDYAIASAYALLIGRDRRKQLSAYFTPPGLAHAALDASAQFLNEVDHPAVLDPACGGGSFLTPVARYLIKQKCARGLTEKESCKETLESIHGIELDPGLATLSQILLRNLLEREYRYVSECTRNIVRCGDALSASLNNMYDLVIGNPPYGKVGDRIDKDHIKRAGFANIGRHTNIYSLFVLRGLDLVKPGGGLVFLLPTSFVAGPYFAGLRQEILSRAEVLRIDMHEQRENLFLGAIQDVCLLTLRKRKNTSHHTDNLSHSYELGFIDVEGARSARGEATAKNGGEPWALPSANSALAFSLQPQEPKDNSNRAFTLSDYGYRVRVGKVVPTRERERLHGKRQKNDLPLVWASCVRPDGSFDFWASKRLGNATWYNPPVGANIGYATHHPAVLIQRTSNRDQKRILNAASVPPEFLRQHKRGFVAENHVIVVEATTDAPIIGAETLATILNSQVVNDRFSTVCGSFSVSAKLLQRMALPDPRQIPSPDLRRFKSRLRQLFDTLGEVLAPLEDSQSASDTKDPSDEPGNLKGSLSVNENSRFKRRAVA